MIFHNPAVDTLITFILVVTVLWCVRVITYVRTDTDYRKGPHPAVKTRDNNKLAASCNVFNTYVCRVLCTCYITPYAVQSNSVSQSFFAQTFANPFQQTAASPH